MAMLRPLSVDNRGIPFLTGTPVASLTGYLPPRLPAHGLILGPWDPRIILYTFYSEQGTDPHMVSE